MTPREVAGFWARAVPDGTGCFVWSGYKTPRGYGLVRLAGRKLRASRAAYEIAIAPIPAGLCIDHLCRNPSCVNPMHLEAVTWKVNTLRGISPVAERAAASRCPNGHPYSEAIIYRGYRKCVACVKAQEKLRRKGQSRDRHIHQPPGASDD